MSGEEEDDGEFFAALLAALDGELDGALTGEGGDCAALLDAAELSLDAGAATAELDASDAPPPAFDAPIASLEPLPLLLIQEGDALGPADAAFALGSSSSGLRRRKDPNKARNERAREIRGLKGEVVELTAQLKTLQTLSVRESDALESGAPRVPLAAELMGTPLVWEAICRNQLSRRARSERENARLKRALEEQARLAHSLERMLKKPSRAMHATGDIDLCASKRVYSLPSDSDADAKIFDLLLAEADAAYYEIDGILALNGIAGAPMEPIRGAQMRDGEHGRFVDMFSSNVLPFSLEATAEVVWRFHSGTGKHRGPLYYKTAKTLETTQSTVIEKFAIELYSSTTRADFRFWQVIRRYVEDDRVLVVWMAVVEPVEVANNAFSSCAFRERGYAVCERESVAASETPFTRFQQCLRFEPYTTHATDKLLSEREKREIGAIIEFMLNQDSVRVYLETLEDELVRASLIAQPPPGEPRCVM